MTGAIVLVVAMLAMLPVLFLLGSGVAALFGWSLDANADANADR